MYCYNCSILLLLIVVNLLLCLIYKLSFIISMYEENIVYIGFGFVWGFQASTGGLSVFPVGKRECLYFLIAEF